MKYVFAYGVARSRVVALLGVFALILAACSSSDESDLIGSAQAELPVTVFTINGKVATANGSAVGNGVVVSPISYREDGSIEKADTLYTDKDGLFVLERKGASKDQEFVLLTNSADSKDGQPFYETDTMLVRFSMNDLYNAGIKGSWDSGKVEKDIYITLREARWKQGE